MTGKGAKADCGELTRYSGEHLVRVGPFTFV